MCQSQHRMAPPARGASCKANMISNWICFGDPDYGVYTYLYCSKCTSTAAALNSLQCTAQHVQRILPAAPNVEQAGHNLESLTLSSQAWRWSKPEAPNPATQETANSGPWMPSTPTTSSSPKGLSFGIIRNSQEIPKQLNSKPCPKA